MDSQPTVWQRWGWALRWLGTAARPPEQVFVVHGDPQPAAALTERIREELGWRASVPEYRHRIALDRPGSA